MSFLNDFPHVRQYDGDLGWLIREVRTGLIPAVEALEEWKNSSQATIDGLNAILDMIRAGNLPADIAAGIKEWIVRNFYDIVGDMAKMVFFGLTDSGYFVAYIPESWDDIDFKTTGWDITLAIQPEYGHLVLEY